MIPRRWLLLMSPAYFAAVLCGCPRGQDVPPAPPRPAKVEAAGLHNVFRLTDQLYSGSSPEGDDGFASLQRLGVRTIISVDGARPDVERARRFGLRYVHLPIGYDGVPEEQGLRIAKAVRDLPGPVYIHCHHGKHRGPASAAVAHLCVDEKCSVEAALEGMRRAGTDPHYTGLYAAPERLHRPTLEDLDRIPDDFPEVAAVPGLAQAMVAIDERWDRLKQARASGWKPPPGHADIDPPHEARQLLEQFREALRLPEVAKRPEEFRHQLVEAAGAAERLEAALRHPQEGAAEDCFQKSSASCTRCHDAHRDKSREQ
jgi:protein tyrosine phosphatase (PTP) superfamily phosphohydrolase (DUF442 family)